MPYRLRLTVFVPRPLAIRRSRRADSRTGRVIAPPYTHHVAAQLDNGLPCALVLARYDLSVLEDVSHRPRQRDTDTRLRAVRIFIGDRDTIARGRDSHRRRVVAEDNRHRRVKRSAPVHRMGEENSTPRLRLHEIGDVHVTGRRVHCDCGSRTRASPHAVVGRIGNNR